jgi:hypothetical protein
MILGHEYPLYEIHGLADQVPQIIEPEKMAILPITMCFVDIYQIRKVTPG